MSSVLRNKKGGGVVLVLVALGVLSSSLVFGQSKTPQTQVLLNWTSPTYAPNGYAGKTLPTGKSWISATVDVIRNGKIVNIDKENIYWYKNDQFIDGGMGLWQINIQAPEIPGDIISLRAEVLGLGGSALKTVDIPTIQPVVVLDAPYPGGYVSGQNIKVSALTYFFDTKNLFDIKYNWKVNNESVKNLESPFYIELAPREGTPDGFSMRVELGVADPKNIFVGAKRIISLTLKNN